ncbi:MAG: helix-turn-helix transcriptional regulator [Lewinellaceae bacterium]|nr:helix-turn-helix transcriptional regulator [Saprospiraceae bacterium]MCB9338442.1 helix-turn-helix transcriptional regulator [Lewinellaceae bacterium]
MESRKSPSDREQIAARLKEARILAGLSQAQAAEKLNLQRPAISEIESGRRKVSAEELLQFSDLYRVDSSWLLMREDENDGKANNQLKFAARELSKLKPEEVQKLLDILKILPK